MMTREERSRRPRSYVALTASLCVAARFAWVLSAPGRGIVDYVVLAVLAAGILWAFAGAVRRLHRALGVGAVQHALRALTLWFGGLLNTAWARPGEPTWRWLAGMVLLALATADTIALALREHRAINKE